MYRIVDFLLSGRISGSGPASRSTIRLRPDSKNRLSGTSLMQACNGHLPLIVRHTVAFCQSAVATKLMIMMMSYTHTQQTWMDVIPQLEQERPQNRPVDRS